MRFGRLALGIMLLTVVVGILFLQPVGPSSPESSSARSQDGSSQKPSGRQVEVMVSKPVVPVLTGPARDLPSFSPEPTLDREINPRQNPYGTVDPEIRIEGGPDPLLDLQENAAASSDVGFGTLIYNFDGQGYTFLNPPDTVGDVGTDHYIQMINSTGVAVYDKHTGSLTSSFDLTSLGGCSTGSGDPVVLFDHAADRWFLSEFGPGSSLCIFISTTPDPLGSYYSYQFNTPTFPDYPKYAVWSDAYYATANENSPSAFALDRTAMLAGSPATSQRFTVPALAGFGFQALTPADWDGNAAPPADSPGFFMRHVDTESHSVAGYPTEDFLEVWAFSVDWSTPGNSNFTKIANVSVAEFDSDLCGLTSYSAIAMPGVSKCSSSSLDPLRETIMWRLQYRNFGSHETLVGNFSTDVTGNDDSGVRWFELRKVGAGGWTLHQEGTYAPDSDSRWMAAIAMDGVGNIALGYNVSSSSTYPSIRYAGRLASDAPGTLPQGEHVLIDGTASNGSNRYGDYSAMSVDPVDDCTFWFTGEYNASSQWSTRVGAFRFDACGVPDFTLAAEPVSQLACVGADVSYDIVIGSVKGYSDPVTLSASGNPAGTYTSFDVNPVIPEGDSMLTIGGTGSAAAGEYVVEIMGVAPTSTHTTTVGLELFDSSPYSPTPLTPSDNAINVSLAPYYSWTPVDNTIVYHLEVATDSGFSNVVYAAAVQLANHTSAVPLDQLTEYFWRVAAENPCGTGAWSDTFSFVTADTPPILLVDDDDNSPDVRDYYTDALNVLVGPVGYDIWDTNNSDDEPNESELATYDVVIWFTGEEFGGAAGPGASGEAALAAWLDSGGCFMISSQDYYWDRGLTSFMQDYLGVQDADSDVGQTTATGAGSIFSGLGPYALDYPFANYSDIVNPNSSAELAFSGSDGNTAVNLETDDFNSTYWGFPWEAVPSAGERQDALQTFLDWCGSEPKPDILVTPTSISETSPSDTQIVSDLMISNIGGVSLDWSIAETTGQDCQTPSDIPWLSVSPDAGTTSTVSSSSVDVTFDSTGMGPGTYTGNLCVSSNDPDPGPGNGTELVIVPLELTVEIVPPPNIDVNPLSITSTQLVYSSVVSSMTISNIGGELLDWSIAETNGQDCQTPLDIPWLSVALDEGTTSSGSSTSVDVTFDSAGMGAGTYTGNLCVFSNDPDPGPDNGTELVFVPLELTVESVPPPDIDVSPLSITSTQLVDVSVMFSLTISNTGGETLDWSIIETDSQDCQTLPDIPWLSVAPDEGTASSGSSTSVDVTFDSTGMGAGTYTGNLCVSSNDPDNGPGNGTELVIVPLELTVVIVPPSNIDVNPLSITSTQLVNSSVVSSMTIDNIGGELLDWSIAETNGQDCRTPSDIPWLSVAPDAGTTSSGSSTLVDVTFDSTGLDEGMYSGNICISSNDGDTPLIAIPVSMNVEFHFVFLPILSDQP